MNNLITLGRFFFAIGMAVFGIQYIWYGRFMGGLPPVPPWAPGGAVGAYLVGAVLIAASLSIAANKKGRLSAIVLGSLFLFCVIVLHGPHLSAILHDGVERTRAFEPLALGGAAFVLAGILPTEGPGSTGPLALCDFHGGFRHSTLYVRTFSGDAGTRVDAGASVLDLFYGCGNDCRGLGHRYHDIGTPCIGGIGADVPAVVRAAASAQIAGAASQWRRVEQRVRGSGNVWRFVRYSEHYV